MFLCIGDFLVLETFGIESFFWFPYFFINVLFVCKYPLILIFLYFWGNFQDLATLWLYDLKKEKFLVLFVSGNFWNVFVLMLLVVLVSVSVLMLSLRQGSEKYFLSGKGTFQKQNCLQKRVNLGKPKTRQKYVNCNILI